jgi:hypothetical protein
VWNEIVGKAFRHEAFHTYRERLTYDDVCPDPLISGLLLNGLPLVLGEPLKTMKTSLSIELAAALATGTSFLGMPVPKPVSVFALTTYLHPTGKDPADTMERLLGGHKVGKAARNRPGGLENKRIRDAG